MLIIRIIERRLDPLIDTTLLDYTPPELQEEWEAVQFDGEWEGWTNLLGRVISPKKKSSSTSKGATTPNTQSRISTTPSKISVTPNKALSPGKMAPPAILPAQGGISASSSAASLNSTVRGSGSNGTIKATPGYTKNTSAGLNGPATSENKSITASSRPSSPPLQGLLSASNSSTFNTIKGAIVSSSIFGTLDAAGSTGPSPAASMSNLTGTTKGGNAKAVTGPVSGPEQVTMLLTALHTFLSLSGINPVLIVQIFSQVGIFSVLLVSVVNQIIL